MSTYNDEQNQKNQLDNLRNSQSIIREMSNDVVVLNNALANSLKIETSINDLLAARKLLNNDDLTAAKDKLKLIEDQLEAEVKEYLLSSNNYKLSLAGKELLARITQLSMQVQRGRTVINTLEKPGPTIMELAAALPQILLLNLKDNKFDTNLLKNSLSNLLNELTTKKLTSDAQIHTVHNQDKLNQLYSKVVATYKVNASGNTEKTDEKNYADTGQITSSDVKGGSAKYLSRMLDYVGKISQQTGDLPALTTSINDKLLPTISENLKLLPDLSGESSSGLGNLLSTITSNLPAGLSNTGGSLMSSVSGMLTSSGGGGGGIINTAASLLGDSGGGGGSLLSTLGGSAIESVMPPWLSIVIKAVSKISQILGEIRDQAGESMQEAVDLLELDSTKKFDSRLYGILNLIEGENANFVDMALDAIDLATYSLNTVFISAKSLIGKMTDLVNEGVAYNVEQRALWATMMDKIVSTFDVLNPTLLRLVQLQLSELTDTYGGIEAAITRTLNSMFTDTLYLNDTYDAVWSAMTDALANVDTDLGAGIAYQVQLWLGSLSSLGLSSDAATNIAQTINNMLTGNTDSLGELGTRLMAMAAANAGLSYGDLLLNGVQSSADMSKFMNSIITVLLNIYTASSDNNVLLSEWGDLLNLSISDWKAISNLSATSIATLAALSNYGQADALKEFEYIEENLVSERTLISERIDTAIENMQFEAGWNIASSKEKYLLWRFSDFLDNLVETFDITGGVVTTVTDWITDAVLDMIALTSFVEPALDLLGSVPSMLVGQSYKSFKDIVPDSGGTIASLIFQSALGESSYVDYSKIFRLSFYQTNSTVVGKAIDWIADIVSGIFGDDDSNSSYSSYSYTVTPTSSATYSGSTNTTNLTNNTSTTLSGTKTTSTVTQTTSAANGTANTTTGTTSNSADTSVNGTAAVTHTIDDLYTLLTGTTGIPVLLVGVNDDVIVMTRELSTLGKAADDLSAVGTTIKDGVNNIGEWLSGGIKTATTE